MFGNELLEVYETLYGAFESVVSEPEEFLEEFSGDWIETFVEVAKENVAPPMVQIDGILEMSSSAPNGMELIRNALLKGLEAADDANVEITCVGCPKYRVVVNASEYKEAEEIMKSAPTAVWDRFTILSGLAYGYWKGKDKELALYYAEEAEKIYTADENIREILKNLRK